MLSLFFTYYFFGIKRINNWYFVLFAKKKQNLYIYVKFYTFYIFLFAKILKTRENTTYLFFLFGSLGEIGKHDRLKICSFAVIGSSPIVSNCSIPLVSLARLVLARVPSWFEYVKLTLRKEKRSVKIFLVLFLKKLLSLAKTNA